jgi:copper resistance protein B
MSAWTTRLIALASSLSVSLAQAQEAGHAHHDARHEPAEHAAMGHSKMDHAAMPESDMPASDHVPPPPPAHVMGDMAYDEMVEVMGMDDRSRFGLVSLDQFEYVEGGAMAWSGQAWYGGDTDRLVLRSEGEHVDGDIAHADIELLWGHAVAPFWDSRIGLRQDFGRGPDRSWAAFGLQGLAPYWFEVSATAYLGTEGRTALRVEAEYEMLLTQRLVLQPRAEINAYGKDDAAAGIGSGLAESSLGLRLRYEIRREFAPYLGIECSKLFGNTAQYARAHGEDSSDLQWVAGLRVWF